MNISRMNAGRPKKNDSKGERCMLRLSKEESDQLTLMSIESGLSKSQLLREGLKMRLNVHKYYDN
jgi:hypothetical protein